MRVQTQILIFILCLNIASGLVTNLQLAGTDYTNPAGDLTGEHTAYLTRLNATETVEDWKPGGLIGQIPILGDLFSMLYSLWLRISFLLIGFPLLLQWIGGTFIETAAGRASYNFITDSLIAIFSIMMVLLFIEFISGRRMPD